MSGVKIAIVANSISGLSVSGVTIKDIGGIPEEVSNRICPVMFPDPDNFVTGVTVTPQSYGAGTVGKNDVRYTLNYIFLYQPIGSGRYIAKSIVGLVGKAVLILNAFIANDALVGSVDLEPSLGDFGTMQDLTGNQFFGVRITVKVYEFFEV